jgi:hypothetical protein
MAPGRYWMTRGEGELEQLLPKVDQALHFSALEKLARRRLRRRPPNFYQGIATCIAFFNEIGTMPLPLARQASRRRRRQRLAGAGEEERVGSLSTLTATPEKATS